MCGIDGGQLGALDNAEKEMDLAQRCGKYFVVE